MAHDDDMPDIEREIQIDRDLERTKASLDIALKALEEIGRIAGAVHEKALAIMNKDAEVPWKSEPPRP